MVIYKRGLIMKKIIITIIILLTLVGCSTETLTTKIGPEQFSETTVLEPFDIIAYIAEIEPIVTDFDYIRLDSIFLEEDQEVFEVSERAHENILNIFKKFEPDHDTYALINFFDLHLKSLTQLEIDIILFKIVERIENDYKSINDLVLDDEFLYLTSDYKMRLTNTFLSNYVVDEEILSTNPDMYNYIDFLKGLINGGYQIRKLAGIYTILPDYTSVLVRYEEYYSDETADAVDILVRESRNVVKANSQILVDNDTIAYKIERIEFFLRKYSSSVYYDLFKYKYRDYFITMITNPDNIEVFTASISRYRHEVISDFEVIINRYENSTMSVILEDFISKVDTNGSIYDEIIVDETIDRINSSY